jgi:hypothetical protein
VAAISLRPGSASASATQQSLQTQADSVAATIVRQGRELHALAVAEIGAKASLSEAEQAVAQSRYQLREDRVRLRNAHHQLEDAVINQFIYNGDITSLATLLSSTEQNNLVRTEYQDVAVSSITNYLFQVQQDQRSTQEAELLLAGHLQRAHLAVLELQGSQAALRTSISQEQSTLLAVNHQLQGLIQAALARQASQRSVQGLPTPSVLQVVARGPASTSKWGGTPAPPTAAAFAALRDCESGGNYSDNTGNGYYGAYQFSLSTWLGLGYQGLPSNAPPAVQDAAALKLEAGGWGQWPACSAILGLS